MAIDLQKVINSPFTVRVLSTIARWIPPHVGYSLCNHIGDWAATRRDSQLIQTVRLHQCMVRGLDINDAALDKSVRETLRNNARDIYNLYYHLNKPEILQGMISFSPRARTVIERPEFSARGLVILGLHLSNFDLALRTLIAQTGFKAMVLTLPDPQGGRRVEYEMRKQSGMNLVPASMGALRGAIKHLENGGMLVTGLDRPVPQTRLKPLFFGRPASLPTHYINLALKAHVPIVVMVVIQQPDGKYHLLASDFIEMEPDTDHEREILRNAERVLKQAEYFIRLAPQQWNVPLPIWTE